jgi:hypothetical protein
MKYTAKKWISVILLILSSSLLHAQSEMKEKVDISKLDRTMTQHRAQKRHFRSKEEFKRHQQQKIQKKHTRKSAKQQNPHLQKKHQKRYGNIYDRDRRYNDTTYDYDYDYYYDTPYRHRLYGRTHRHPKRGWVLAYKYDRAEFYDRDGFHYGYFNRYGYMFEGEFYRYDRYYRYRDRVRGRGLFDRYYYRPVEWRYYGFCR